jgi:hypothetical protein
MRAMRFLLWFVLVLGVLWAGYWFVGARAVRQGAEAAFAQARTDGLVAETSGLSVAGFADRFDLTVNDVHLADPVSGWGWQAPFAQVFAMTWKPWHLIAALPHTQVVTLPDAQKVTIGSDRLMASLLMRPSLDLTFRRAVVEGEGLALTSDRGWAGKAEKAVLAAETDPTRANTLHLGADVTNLTPPAALMALPDLGPVVGVLHLDGRITLSQPIDRNLSNPQVQAVGLTALHLAWGAMDLGAQGDLVPDAQGLAQGTIDLRLKGWRSLPAVVVALGLLPSANAITLQRGLEFFAKSGTDPEVIALPLTFKAGVMSLGPLPLGPSPRLN